MDESYPFEARLLHDFEAENDQELSVREGVVVNVEGYESGWYVAELNGDRGLVPKSYVERMDNQIVPSGISGNMPKIGSENESKKKSSSTNKRTTSGNVTPVHSKEKVEIPGSGTNDRPDNSIDFNESIDDGLSNKQVSNSIFHQLDGTTTSQGEHETNTSQKNESSPHHSTTSHQRIGSNHSSGSSHSVDELSTPPRYSINEQGGKVPAKQPMKPFPKGSTPPKLGPKKVPIPPDRKKDMVSPPVAPKPDLKTPTKDTDNLSKTQSIPKLPPKPANTSSIGISITPPPTVSDKPVIPPKARSSRTLKSHSVSDTGKSLDSNPLSSSEPIIERSNSSSIGKVDSEPVEEVVGEDYEQRRYYIVKEILSTEKSYVAGLEEAIQTYFKPLLEASRREGAESDVKTLFSTMEHILPLNLNLLKSLEDKVNQWSPEQNIGDVFLRFAPFLKMYTTYSNNYDNALEALNRLSAQNWFLQIAEMKIKIEAYIITPIQRIPRYSLLLADLLKHTSNSHKDKSDISKALDIVKDVASHVNRSVGIHKNVSRLTDAGLAYLLAPHRVLLRDGTINVTSPGNEKVKKRIILSDKTENKKAHYHFLLFNDTISFVNHALDDSLMPKKEKKTFRIGKTLDPTKSKHKRVTWPLYLVWLKDIGLSSGFEVYGPTTQFTMYFSSNEEREAWWNALNECIYKELVKIDESYASTKNIASTLLIRNGKYNFKDGEYYEGAWKQGKIIGEGIMNSFGATFKGTFDNGFKVGKGIIKYQTGQTYAGSWKDGKPTGKGKMEYLDKSVYDGEFKDGKRHGKGLFTFSDTSYYDGEWRGDLAHGSGNLVLKRGLKYQGMFLHGHFQGKGVLTYPNGEVYTGNFQAGMRHGKGSIQYIDGSHYDGEWKEDKRHGHGTFVSKDRGTYDGEWKNDYKEGRGNMHYITGETYEGGWNADKPHGHGVWKYKDSNMIKYEGEFSHGKRQGKGCAYYRDESKYDGEWSDDLYSGYGKYISSNGALYEGKWNLGCLDTKISLKKPDSEERMGIDSNEDSLSYNIVSTMPIFDFTHTHMN